MRRTRYLLPVLTATALSLITAFATADQEQVNACGHDNHDTMEVRAQAVAKVHWRSGDSANEASWKRIKILGFNDFHGALQSRTVAGRPAGGAAVLASYFAAESAGAKDNGVLIVHAGDHVGASPPISALLQDEPSMRFLNMLGNEHCKSEQKWDPQCNIVGTLGNHEFDEGVAELQRLIDGGNHANGPFLNTDWTGTNFPYVIANVVDSGTGKTLFPPYVIKNANGMRIAFIGIVLKATPTIVTPSGVAGVQFLDEAESINKYVEELKAKNVHAIVVTIHQGAKQSNFVGPTPFTPIASATLGGDIGPIVHNLDDDVDIVVSGHWHQFTNALVYNQNHNPLLVTQAFAHGTAYAVIDVAVDPKSKDIVEKTASIVTTYADAGPGLNPDSQIAAMVRQSAQYVAPLVNRIVGESASAITRVENAAGESAMGNLIADAQRAAMATDIALMNPGGIRADLDAGPITWGELFTIQPFKNDLVKLELSGRQIIEVLNQQWSGQSFARILKTSGLTYTWDGAGTADFTDDRVVTSSVQIGGAPLNPQQSYTVTVNSFMAGGGDNFTQLTQGAQRIVGPVDLDASVDYVKALANPISYATENRIQRIN